MGDPPPDDEPLELMDALARARALGLSALAYLDDAVGARLPIAEIYLALTAAAAATRVAAYTNHLARLSPSNADAVRAALSLYQARWLYAQLRGLASGVPVITELVAYLEAVVRGGPLRADRRLLADAPEHWLRGNHAAAARQLISSRRTHHRSSLSTEWSYTAGQLPLLRSAAVDAVNIAVKLQQSRKHAAEGMEDLRRDFQENSPLFWRTPSARRAEIAQGTLTKGEQLSRAMEARKLRVYITSVREDRLWVMNTFAALDPSLLTCRAEEIPLRFELCCTARAAFDGKWLEQLTERAVPSVQQCEAAIEAYRGGINAALHAGNGALLRVTAEQHPNFPPLVALVTAVFAECESLGIPLKDAERLVSQTAQATLLDQTYSGAEIGYPDPEVLLGVAIDMVRAARA